MTIDFRQSYCINEIIQACRLQYYVLRVLYERSNGIKDENLKRLLLLSASLPERIRRLAAYVLVHMERPPKARYTYVLYMCMSYMHGWMSYDMTRIITSSHQK